MSSFISSLLKRVVKLTPVAIFATVLSFAQAVQTTATYFFDQTNVSSKPIALAPFDASLGELQSVRFNFFDVRADFKVRVDVDVGDPLNNDDFRNGLLGLPATAFVSFQTGNVVTLQPFRLSPVFNVDVRGLSPDDGDGMGSMNGGSDEGLFTGPLESLTASTNLASSVTALIKQEFARGTSIYFSNRLLGSSGSIGRRSSDPSGWDYFVEFTGETLGFSGYFTVEYTAIPEPGTYALILAAAAGGLVVFAKKRRASAAS